MYVEFFAVEINKILGQFRVWLESISWEWKKKVI